MKKVKIFKLTCMVLALCMTLCVITILPVSAKTYKEGSYTYTVTDDEATITLFDTEYEGDVVIPSTLDGYPVVEIKNDAFFNCYKVTSVTIPETVRVIGDGAFYAMSSLGELKVDEKNLNYSSSDGILFDKGGETLVEFPHIKEADVYTVPLSVKNIAKLAFCYCANIGKVVLPDSVETIGESAFAQASPETIEIGSGVTTLGNTVFNGCPNLKKVEFKGGPEILPTETFIDCVVLDTVILGSSLTTIKGGAFSYCDSLKSINIPKGVTSIAGDSFTGCPALEEITVEEGSEKYASDGGVLFNNTKKTLCIYPVNKAGDTYTIPETVTAIGSYAFSRCNKLKSVVFDSKLKTINTYAFINCTNLETVELPASVTTIGNYAFMNCSKLKSASISGSVATLGTSVFAECGSLETVSLPESLTSIGKTAFLNCRMLSDVTIGENVSTIGARAFYGCDGLENVSIPKSVTSIGSEAFSDCKSICSFEVDGENENYASEDGVLFNKDKTILIIYPPVKDDIDYKVPDSVTDLALSAFYNNQSIESVTLGHNVLTIGDTCFKGCINLSELTFGTSLKFAGTNAFMYCDKISDIYYGGGESDWKLISGVGSLSKKNIHYSDIETYNVQSVKTDKDKQYATMRFFFRPTYYGSVADSFGAYIIPLDVFEDMKSPTALVEKKGVLESGTTFSADLKNIPAASFDADILAIPFIKSGESVFMVINTEAYEGNTVTDTDIDKAE